MLDMVYYKRETINRHCYYYNLRLRRGVVVARDTLPQSEGFLWSDYQTSLR